MHRCDYVYVEGFRFPSGTPVVELTVNDVTRRLAVVRTGAGRSRVGRLARKPRPDGVVGEITLRDLRAVLARGGQSSVLARIPLGEHSCTLLLDPRRAMGSDGRVDDAALLQATLARLGPDQQRLLAASQLASAPYGEKHPAATRARLVSVITVADAADLLACPESNVDVFRFWDHAIHAALCSRADGDELLAALTARLTPLSAFETGARTFLAVAGVGDVVPPPLVTVPAAPSRRRGGRQVVAGVNDLATTHPELAAQAHGWDPSTVSAGSQKHLAWRCEHGHVWSARVGSRTLGTGCAVCTGKMVVAGVNDLATTHPELAAQAHGWDPSTLTAGSNTKAAWCCSAGHVWEASCNTRRAGKGCPFCSGRLAVPGVSDLATTHPELAAQAHGWDPSTRSAGSGASVRWRCEHGHVWSAKVNDRTHGTGCPRCAAGGFDQTGQGWLYLLSHDAWGMRKIGISNVPLRRVRAHAHLGWELVEVRGPMDGVLCRSLERAALALLADRGAVFANDLDVVPFDGWTESWRHDSFPVTSLGALLALLDARD